MDTENKAWKHPEKLGKEKQIKAKEIQREEIKRNALIRWAPGALCLVSLSNKRSQLHHTWQISDLEQLLVPEGKRRVSRQSMTGHCQRDKCIKCKSFQWPDIE